MSATELANTAAARTAREAYGRLLAALAMRFRDIAAAEDALSEAFAQALARWPETGVPRSPEAWLMTVAKNQLRQRARHQSVTVAAGVVRALEQVHAELSERAPELADHRLRLLLVCAHPAIDEAVRTPLMLQTVLGLDAARIAHAYLVAPAAMGQRLVRAKQKIRDAGISFELPEASELPSRMASVREAVYAAFGVDFDAPARSDGGESQPFADEALYLAHVLSELAPDDAECLGLYALLRLSYARRAARFREDGSFVPLTKQDVARWNRAAILEGNATLLRAAACRVPGPFQLEAAIQSAHCQRLFSGQTPWSAIDLLYSSLNRHWPTISSAVAHAAVLVELERLDDARQLLTSLEPARVESYAPYWVVLSHVLRKKSQREPARAALVKGIALTANASMRAYLLAELAEFDG